MNDHDAPADRVITEATDAENAPTMASDVTHLNDPSEEPTLLISETPQRAAVPSLEPGDQIGERYEILAVIGEGGCGVVYKARDRSLDRTVALKTIHPSVAASSHALERFKREILLASKISHRNVVRIHDLGEVGQLQFISMAFIEGCDLKQKIRRDGPLDLDQALPLIRQLAEALQAAHEAGVVHRDLKPQNVLLDESGKAYIGDFGISRSIDHGQTMTETGMLVGTMAYMSPEQARGETADHRSDIYSFGLILYEMFAGSVPFGSGSALSALMKRAEQDVPTIDATRADLPAWMVRIVARCLERDADARYQSMGEILADLDRQRATGAGWRRSWTRLVRNAAAVVVVIGVATLGIWWWTNREPPPPPGVRASLMIAPFRNVTGDQAYDWTRTGLPDLLRAELRQSPGLLLTGSVRVAEIFDGLKLETGSNIDSASVLTLSRLTGAESLLTGEFIRAGDRFRLEARLFRAGSSTVAEQARLSAEGQGEQSLFAIVDDLGGQVRRELGLGSGRGRGTAELSTRSVDALRQYSLAAELARQGSDLQAAEQLELAVGEDPEFFLARAMLAETYGRLGRPQEALAEADKAAAGLSKVSPDEALRIRAVRARLAGDHEAAAAAYSELCTLTPNRPEPHLALADLLEDAGQLDEALVSLDRVIELDSKNPSALFARGRVRAKLGQTGGAVEDFNAALGLHAGSHNDEGRATVLNGLGNVYSILGEYEQAMRNYEEALRVREELGDRRGVAIALSNISLAHADVGEFEQAIEWQQKSLAVYEELSDDVGLAGSLADLGDIYAAAGRVEQALDLYTRSLDVLRDTDDDAGLARAFSNLGYVYTVLGRYNEAFFFQKNSLDKRRGLGEKQDLLLSLVDIGNVELIQGHYDEALGYYEEGLGLARDAGNVGIRTVLAVNIGDTHLQRGRFAAALSSLSEAADMARDSGDRYHLAVCLALMAETLRSIGDYARSEKEAREAVNLAQEVGSAGASSAALVSLGRLLQSTARAAEAVEVFREASSAAEASEDHRRQLLARLASGQALASLSEIRSVIEDAEASGLDPVAAAASLALALTHSDKRETAEAARAAERALEIAGPMNQRDVQFQAHGVAAGARHAQGELALATEHVLAALGLLEEMRRGLDDELRSRFASRRETVAFKSEAEVVLTAAGRGEALEQLRQLEQ